MGHLIHWESLFFFQIPHKSSMGHLFRCGFFYLFFSHRFSHKSSMGRLFQCGSSVLLFWISLKSSMGRLFRCGSSILLFSDLTQVLYGSLVSVWIIYSFLIRFHTSPLLGHLLSSLYAHVCMCVKDLLKELAPPTTLLQLEFRSIFVFKCFASSHSDVVDPSLRLHSISVNLVIDPHSP